MKNRRQVLSMLGFGTLAAALGGATAFVARASNFEQIAADAIGKPVRDIPWASSFSTRSESLKEFKLTGIHIVSERKPNDVERIFAVHWQERDGNMRCIDVDRLFGPKSLVTWNLPRSVSWDRRLAV